MSLLVATHPLFVEHETGPGHPERPGRLAAVHAGLEVVRDAVIAFEPRAARTDEVSICHRPEHVAEVQARIAAGERRLDADTAVGPHSFDAALHAAGAGLETIERLDADEADHGFCAVRPPGHHALADRSMGFCLFNSVAVAATALANRGERVAIVDFDAHHGNGTQAIFYDDPRVLFVSLHQFPFYPGTGAWDEMGEGDAWDTTVNLPLPAEATGDVYRHGLERVIAQRLESFDPTWLLYSAGFDAHRLDPLTSMGLAAADYADIVHDVDSVVSPKKRLAFLEGGYDLDALRMGTASFSAALLDVDHRPEPPTSGGPGLSLVDAIEANRARTERHDQSAT